MEEEDQGQYNNNAMAFDRRRTAAGGAASSLSSNNRQEDVLYQMRMAGTFDSVDNLVDSKSLLPGGRWVVQDNPNNGISTTATTTRGEMSTSNTNKPVSEMDMRNKLALTGQVAEVCSVCIVSYSCS